MTGAAGTGGNMSPAAGTPGQVYLPAQGTSQRQHSTSFYNQLNQTSGFYTTQPGNQQQARQGTYQQQQPVQYQVIIPITC